MSNEKTPPFVLRPLPDPLVFNDGRPVISAQLWRERRGELLETYARLVYGRMPGAPNRMRCEQEAEDFVGVDGLATVRQVALRFTDRDEPALHVLLYLPAQRTTPAPVMLALNFAGNHTTNADKRILLSQQWIPDRRPGENNRATEATRGVRADRWPVHLALQRGYAVATFYHGDADADRVDYSDGLQALYYRPGQDRPAADEWGTLAVWAWGLSRALDYLHTESRVDAKRVAVFGHSRNGKTALLAGATDERFGAVISLQSGCGGAALFRGKRGENIAQINRSFPHWFCDNFKAYNGCEDDLPVDQHELIALSAPRPVLVSSAEDDLWADPDAEFAAAKSADPVFRLLGTDGLRDDRDLSTAPMQRVLGGTLGYFRRPGEHSVNEGDWLAMLEFLDRAGWSA